MHHTTLPSSYLPFAINQPTRLPLNTLTIRDLTMADAFTKRPLQSAALDGAPSPGGEGRGEGELCPTDRSPL